MFASSMVQTESTERIERYDGSVVLLPPGIYIVAPTDGREMPMEMDAEDLKDDTLRIWCDCSTDRATGGGIAPSVNGMLSHGKEMTCLMDAIGDRVVGLPVRDALRVIARYVVDELKVDRKTASASKVWVMLASTDVCHLDVDVAYNEPDRRAVWR